MAAILRDEVFEPHHICCRCAGAEEYHEVADEFRICVVGLVAAGYDHGGGAEEAEDEPRDLAAREAVDARGDGYDEHEQRNYGVDYRSVDWRRARESVHEQQFAQCAHDYGRGKHVFYILAVDLLTLLPEGWYPREQCRGHERCRDHCQRFDVVPEYDVVEGVVARPDDVAEQQRQMGAVIESFGLFHCLHFPASRAKDLPKCAEKAWEHDGVA